MKRQSSHAPKSEQIDISLGARDSDTTIAMKYFNAGRPDLAFLIQAEGLETKAYHVDKDPNMVTIGVGYNVTAQNPKVARREMRQAGIPQEKIEKLLMPSKEDHEGVEITKQQSLALLEISSKRYEARARSQIGSDIFDNLAPNKKAALVGHCFNGGGLGPKLVGAIQSGDDYKAIKELATYQIKGDQKLMIASTHTRRAMYYADNDGGENVIRNFEDVKRKWRSGYAPFVRDENLPGSPAYHGTRIARSDPRHSDHHRDGGVHVDTFRAAPEMAPPAPSMQRVAQNDRRIENDRQRDQEIMASFRSRPEQSDNLRHPSQAPTYAQETGSDEPRHRSSGLFSRIKEAFTPTYGRRQEVAQIPDNAQAYEGASPASRDSIQSFRDRQNSSNRSPENGPSWLNNARNVNKLGGG